MQNREAALSALSALNIPYELVEHKAVYTIDEVKELGLMEQGLVCKNLFLRDAKGKRHYIVVMDSDKKADLEKIGLDLASTRLSFASESRLQKILGLERGAVTPLGIINDLSHEVTVVFDDALKGEKKIGIHPNDNTATIWLDFESLERLVSHYGNEVCYIKV